MRAGRFRHSTGPRLATLANVEDPVTRRLSLVLDASPEQVRARLAERLFVIGDLWLPTRAELRDWSHSTAPLYVRFTRRGGFEVGPRLETVPAARFAPAMRATLTAARAGRTELHARLRWPVATAVMLWGFTIAVVLWGAAVAWQLWLGDTHLGWAGAVVATLLVVQGSAMAAWSWGRRQLQAELPWLEQTLGRPVVEGEDWG